MRNRQAETLDSPAFSEALPLLWDGASCGTAETIREGLYLRFRTAVPAREGLWRVWLRGENGEVRLGTLEPSCTRPGTAEPADGRLALSRRLSIRSLAPLGRLLRCEIRPALEDCAPHAPGRYGQSAPENAGRPLLETNGQSTPENAGRPLLETNGQSAPGNDGQSAPGKDEWSAPGYAGRPVPDILPRSGGGVLLAFPAVGPFPLPDLFCFARLDTVQGQERWLFAFDGAGRPVFR